MSYEKPFDLMALDSNYDLTAIITYSSVQWNRKCLEPGTFVIELVTDQYTSDWKYVYSPDRRELGRISQVNMALDKGIMTVTISGKFIEDDLNRMIVYPKPTSEYSASTPHTSIVNGPNWLGQSNDADVVAKAFFDAFKSITYMGYDVGDYSGTTLKERTYTLNIDDGIIDVGEYVRAEHHRNGEYLGNKISQILKPSHAFYQVNYDYQTNQQTFDIKHGRDLTNDNTDGNNPVIFSTQNGTIAKASVVKSNTATKDIVLAFNRDDEKTEVLVNGYDLAIGRFLVNASLPSDDDYPVDLDYRLAVLQDSTNLLSDNQDKLNLSFEVFNGSYEYRVDFELGDIVSIELPELNLSINAQVIGCYEVIQNGVWNLDIEFGTPLKRR